MKKKGFTLIELLAVIVILAVILTIAVPAVKKTVDSAKKKSAENDALMIKNIAEKYYTSNLDKDEEITGVDLSTDTLSYSGEKPTKGYLYFTEDGIAYGKMYINGYCVEVKSDGTNTSEKVSIDDCNIADISTGGNTSGGNQGGSESGSGSESEGSTTTPALISFTIDGTSYQAEEGMTWEQWVNSDYNTGFSVLDNTIYNGRRNGYVDGVVCSDIIQANSYLIHLAGAD